MIIARLWQRKPHPLHPELVSRLDAQKQKLTDLAYYCAILTRKVQTMQTALDALKDEVARLTDMPASIAAAFDGLKAQLAEAIANKGDPAAVNAIVADLHAKIDAVAAAIPANT